MPTLQPELVKRLMKFAIFRNTYQPKKSLHTLRLFELLRKQGAGICTCREFYQFLTTDLKMEVPIGALLEDNGFTTDMVINIGGDGTFLKTAHRVGREQVPALGINTGRLGFLADVSPGGVGVTFEEIQTGRYSVEERSISQLICNGRNLQESPCALNEVVVLKRDGSSMISIHTTTNDTCLNTYQAGGLVITTPTDSIAYSLGVGGPIIILHSSTIAITPVAPHSLSVRPIVIHDDWEITLDVESRSRNFLVAVDGDNETCKGTTQLTIRRADCSIKVVERFNHIFPDTLRDEMIWETDGRR